MILGVDPGLTGGLALLSEGGLLVEPMPRTEDGDLDVGELARFIGSYSRDIDQCFIEKIFAMPKNGADSMMKFGMSFGVILGILACYRIPTVQIRPQVWMKVMHAGLYGDALTTKDKSVEA